MSTFNVSFLPGGLAALIVLVLLLCAVVVYALYCKGNVHVLFSHGKTVFEIDAKERSSPHK